MSLRLLTRSAAETENVGAALASCLGRGDVLALIGPLGAGKTGLVKGLARGLRTDPHVPVTSPSFVLMHEYPGPLPLYHFDFYRLRREEEVWSLGWEEYFDGDGVCAVEWADKFPVILAAAGLQVEFEVVEENVRQITIKFAPPQPPEREEKLRLALHPFQAESSSD